MNHTTSYYVKKSVLTIIAVFFMAVGIQLFLFSGFGMDSLSVFIQGQQFLLQKIWDPGTMYGTSSLIFNGTFLVIALICARKHVFIGTVITTFFLGSICNLIEPVLKSWFPGELSLPMRVVFMLVGQLLLCLTIGLQIATRFGQSAPDAVLFKISDVTGIYYKYLRIGLEVVCVVAGWLLGGVVGIGTILCVVTTGPVTSFFAKIYNRTFLKAMGLDDPLNEMKPEKVMKREQKDTVGVK